MEYREVIDDLKQMIYDTDPDQIFDIIESECQSYLNNNDIDDFIIDEELFHNQTIINIHLKPTQITKSVVVNVTIEESVETKRRRKIKQNRILRQDKINQIENL